MIQVTKIRKAFHDAGLQIPAETVNILNDHVNRMVNRWIENTKDGNIKRLSPGLTWVALGLGRENK